MTHEMIRVVVIDDHDLVRSTLRRSFERHPDIEVVGEADGGEAGLEVVRVTKPDVVIVDGDMPGMNGGRGQPARDLEAVERTTGFEPATPTLARWCSTTEPRPHETGAYCPRRAPMVPQAPLHRNLADTPATPPPPRATYDAGKNHVGPTLLSSLRAAHRDAMDDDSINSAVSGPERAPPAGWLLLAPDAVPERWRDRGVPMVLVPLLPAEASAVLTGGSAAPVTRPEDEQLLRLAARGEAVGTIARHLHLGTRTVQRRLARYRDEFGVASATELRVELARRGFSERAGDG